MGCLKFLGYAVLFVALAIPPAVYYSAHYTDFTGMFPLLSVDRTFFEEDVPDVSGQTVFITGANSGLGFSTAKIMAKNGAKTILACRSEKKCTKAKDQIVELYPDSDVSTHVLNLGSLGDVQKSAEELLRSKQEIDMLVLNAGVMIPPHTITGDGLELQFGVNHVAHAYFTLKVLPLVQQAAKSHGSATITVVSSFAHKQTPASVKPLGIFYDVDEMNREDLYEPAEYYGQSKLANILFSNELSKRLGDGNQNIFVNAIHPGAVATELARHIGDSYLTAASAEVLDMLKNSMNSFAWQPDEAALTQVYTAASPDIREQAITGQYFTPIARVHHPSNTGCTEEEAVKLWDFTDKILGDRGFTDYEHLSA